MSLVKQLFHMNAANTNRHRQLGIAAILSVVMIWSGWIIVSSWGIHQSLTSWDITFLRFCTAALVTAPLLYKRRKNLSSIFNLRVALCALGCGFPYTMTSFLGLAQSPASNAGVIVNGLLPILTAIMSFLWYKQRIPSHKFLGIGLIAAANALIFFDGGSANLVGSLLLLCAALFLSAYSVSMRVWNISVEVLIVAVPWINALLFLPIWLFAPTGIHAASQGEIMLQILYQGVLVSVIALFLMTHSIHILGSVTASTFMGLVPVVSAFLAFFILHESLTLLGLISVCVCSVGIVVYNLRNTPTPV
jgi:drug/metabolite transporter (DMT)-like permease